jgi:hypothetical protein
MTPAEAILRLNGSKHFSSKRKVLLCLRDPAKPPSSRSISAFAGRGLSFCNPMIDVLQIGGRLIVEKILARCSRHRWCRVTLRKAAHRSLFGQDRHHNLWLFSTIIKRNKGGDCEER